MTILVSICCITYNHEKYIRQCLDGFVMQKTTFPFEVLVHEDASTDSTADIVKEYELKYPNLFRCVYQTENQFLKQNTLVNILFKMAKGKYIALCEGDDYWTDPYKLQKQVDFLERNEEYVLCAHNASILENGSLRTHSSATETLDLSLIELLSKNPLMTASVVFKNIILPLPEWVNDSPFGDYAIYLNAIQYGKIAVLPENMSVYRVHSGGVHSALFYRPLGKIYVYKKHILFYERIKKYLFYENKDLLKLIDGHIYKYFLKLLFEYKKNNKYIQYFFLRLKLYLIKVFN